MNAVKDWSRAATHLLASSADVDAAEGLPLAAFQKRAAQRLCDMANEWGGALLADDVGLGKTRVLLTAASALQRAQRMLGVNRPAWCIAPARTLPAWTSSARAAGQDDIRFLSYASLARGRLPDEPPSLLLIDEAHRLRNRGTKRRDHLMEHLTVPILLATATPVVNGLDDLRALLELFLDDDDVRALTGWDLATAFGLAEQGDWDLTELLRLTVVRRTQPYGADFGRRPSARLAVVHYEPAPAEAWLWRHLEPELRRLSDGVLGGEWPRGLFVEHVLRRWESGPDALVETLQQLRTFCERAVAARRNGRDLDRSTFRTLFGASEDQEVFAFLYPESAPAGRGDLSRDLDLLTGLQRRAQAALRDSGRDALITELARKPEPLLVFTSYQRAAESLFRSLQKQLGPTASVGIVTGRRAAATGLGRTTAHDVLRRFAPVANGAASLRSRERIRVLVATDCVAEGVNLQDCGRVVLADLPYTPLGVEQRIGRLLRPGGPHEEVVVYLPRPTRWNDSLGMRRRLDAKVDAARTASMGPTTPLFDVPRVGRGPLGALTGIDRLAAQFDALEPVPSGAFAAKDARRWLVLARVGRRQLPVACIVDASGTVTYGLEAVLRELSDAVWSTASVQSVETPDVVRYVVEERAGFLRAATAAPARLGLDAPEVIAWKRLTQSQAVDDIEELRRRLLRPLPAGLRRRLEQLLAGGCSVARLARFVERLPEPADSTAGFELISCLGLPATSAAGASADSHRR